MPTYGFGAQKQKYSRNRQAPGGAYFTEGQTERGQPGAEELLKFLGSPTGGPQNLLPSILAQSKAGSPEQLNQWMRNMAPFIASSLFRSPGYNFLQDPSNWDQSMQAYGAGAGMLAQGARQAQTQGQNQLARMGLGRSGAQAALANQTTQALAGQQSNLFTNLFQQSIQNKLSGAQRAFDLDQAIIRLALGSLPAPFREDPSQQSGVGGLIAQTLGSAAGMGLGALVGGPAGAAAGASLGSQWTSPSSAGSTLSS